MSLVNTDLNFYKRMSALDWLSLNHLPFSLSGVMPVESCILDLIKRQKGLLSFLLSPAWMVVFMYFVTLLGAVNICSILGTYGRGTSL